MKDYTIRTDCRLCGGPLSPPIFDVGETALANEYVSDPSEPQDTFPEPQDTFPLYIVECLTCHHVQLPVVVNPERLYARGYKYQSGTSPVYRAHLEKYADEITELCGQDLKILEVGSNDGTFLRMLQARGHTVVGADPAGTGDDVIVEFFTEASIPRVKEALGGLADVVVANHVFAHVADLPELADAIRGVLRENGRFIFEVGDGLNVSTGQCFDLVYHEHLDYHQARCLAPLLERHGLWLCGVDENSAQGGSIRCRAIAYSVPMIHGCRPDNRLKKERACAVDHWFNEAVRNARRSVTITGMSGPCSAGVVAFGACAKLTTFCAATGWRPPKVYDDNPAKVGLHTPGTHIPIVAAREILTDNPPAVLVTAWNFYEEIRDRLRAWGYRGDIVRALPSFYVDRWEAAA
ncbi:MAG: methyltransferase domain-containing protein [Anaerolineae bacterium]|nr:MAG: methyltransferase domain-containing protein [Anaerolineae bacterium]